MNLSSDTISFCKFLNVIIMFKHNNIYKMPTKKKYEPNCLHHNEEVGTNNTK